jgi:hypothetical protein
VAVRLLVSAPTVWQHTWPEAQSAASSHATSVVPRHPVAAAVQVPVGAPAENDVAQQTSVGVVHEELPQATEWDVQAAPPSGVEQAGGSSLASPASPPSDPEPDDDPDEGPDEAPDEEPDDPDGPPDDEPDPEGVPDELPLDELPDDAPAPPSPRVGLPIPRIESHPTLLKQTRPPTATTAHSLRLRITTLL